MGNVECIDYAVKTVPSEHTQETKRVCNAPSSKYATLVREMPPLPEHVEAIIRATNSSEQVGKAVKQAPTYYIYQKAAFYQGHWKDRLPHGYGRILFSDQSYFEGMILEGQPDSGLDSKEESFYCFPDRSYYIGAFKNGKFEGKGKLICKDNEMKYLGDFKAGVPHGRGVQVFPLSEQRYEGSFRNGQKWGQGKYFINRELVYQGEFKAGNMHGKGRLTEYDGSQFVGKFSNGKKVAGELQSSIGNILGGSSTGDIRGAGFYEWDDGKFYLGQIVEGKFEGSGTIYHPNGRVIEGRWRRGKNVEITDAYNKSVERISEIRAKYIERINTEREFQNESKEGTTSSASSQSEAVAGSPNASRPSRSPLAQDERGKSSVSRKLHSGSIVEGRPVEGKQPRSGRLSSRSKLEEADEQSEQMSVFA